jgi:hypothetical protein
VKGPKKRKEKNHRSAECRLHLLFCLRNICTPSTFGLCEHCSNVTHTEFICNKIRLHNKQHRLCSLWPCRLVQGSAGYLASWLPDILDSEALMSSSLCLLMSAAVFDFARVARSFSLISFSFFPCSSDIDPFSLLLPTYP